MKYLIDFNDTLTIDEVFARCGDETPTFQYVWFRNCRYCADIVKEVDPEYSFTGTRKEFLAKYGEGGEYEGVLDLDTEVDCISPERCYFRYERFYNDDPMVCPICEELFW